MIFLSLSACLKNEEVNLAFTPYEPLNIGDGLIISNPDIENSNSSVLNLF